MSLIRRFRRNNRYLGVILTFAMVLSSFVSLSFQLKTAQAEEPPVSESDRITSVISPGYRSEINDDTISVEFYNKIGTSAIVYSQKQPDDLSNDSNGSRDVVGEVDLVDGYGTVEFRASEYPYGPISLRIQVLKDGAEIDNCYIQLYNNVGVNWRAGLDKAPVNPVTAGMDVVYTDDFKTMPTISKSGIGTKYASAKIDEARGGMFGWAAFEDYDGPYNPFAIASDEFMKLKTTYHPTGYVRNDYWKQKVSTGYLSSENQAGGGFHTEGGRNQYFESRMFFGPNPGMWPAFWTLTANGYVQNPNLQNEPSDELDILEGYMGSPSGYQIAWHPWGYDKDPGSGYDPSKLGGGYQVNLDTPAFNNINLAMGFHTLGVYITKEWTYYYCDNIEVVRHQTLPYSWEYGSYFIINAALSDHYGISPNSNDPFENFDTPTGFTRYGNESETFVDWVRVYQDAPNMVRFESEPKVKALAGDVVRVNINRNTPAADLTGNYQIELPAGWKILEGDSFVDVDGVYEAAFSAGVPTDTLTFLVSNDYSATENITITPVSSDNVEYDAIVISAEASSPDGELVRVDAGTFPYRSNSGESTGSWLNYDPDTNINNYFNFISGNWWRDSWSWMYVADNPDSKLQFKFKGVSVAMDMIQCDICGPVDIYLDGELQKRFDAYGSEQKPVVAFEKSGLEDADHTLEVRGVDGAANRYIRVNGFEYRHIEDPTVAKFWTDNTFFSAGPGDELNITINRNGAAGTKFGDYVINFPSAGWKVLDGSEWKEVTSQRFSTNNYTDTIVLKVPEGYNDKSGKVVITPTIADGIYDQIRIAVQAPDASEAAPITGDGQMTMVDGSSYPFALRPGTTFSSWSNFDKSSQPFDYFTFNGGWWSDSWSWMYTTASPGQTLTFTFEGDAAALYARYISGGSQFDVYLDGVKQTSVDTNGNSGKRRVFSKSDLPVAEHVLEIRVTGSSGSVAFEGFEYDYVQSTESKTVRVDSSTYPYIGTNGSTGGNWANFDANSQSHDYFTSNGGWWNDSWAWMYDRAGNDGDTMAFTFEGVSTALYMRTYEAGGLLDVYLDGHYETTVDSKSASSVANVKVYEKTGLRGGEHTLELKVKGDGSREAVIIDAFEYVYDPAAPAAEFSAPAQVNVTPGQTVNIPVHRDEAAQALSGTYDITLPDGDWSVVSGTSFVADSETDTIVLNVPEEYVSKNGKIIVTPTVGGETYPPITITAVAPQKALGDIVTLLSPEYRAELDGTTVLDFIVPGGYTKAAAYSLHQPDAEHPDPSGYVVEFAATNLDGEGKGTVTFPADDYPHGPTAVKVVAWKADGVSKVEDYFQFFNKGGADWNISLDNAPTPAQLEGRGMQVSFKDDFQTMPSISKSGIDSQGNRTTYISHKPDYGDYGDALFADHGGAYDPFAIVEDYMRIKTTKYDEPLPANVDGYRRHYTTGFLSSVGEDGVGFRTKGYVEQYLEARFFVGANPKQWPAFWTLTSVSGSTNDELDIIEAYLPTTSGYQIATHPWGYDSSFGGGKSVKTVDLLGDAGDIAMGFHTYGVLITEEYSYYYFDNHEVYKQKTLPLSWRNGSFFIINNAMTQSDSYPEGYGFERYGNESDMYIDWVRVYEQPAPKDVVFDTTNLGAVSVTPGNDLSIDINRVTDGAKALAGTYEIDMPAGWTVVSGGSFSPGASKDTLVLHVPDNYAKHNYDLKITPVASDGTSYKTLSVPTTNTDNSFGVEIYPALNDAKDGWDVKVALVNKRASGTYVGGSVEIEAPDSLAGHYEFGEIPPNSRQIVSIPASMLSSDNKTQITFHITREDGYERDIVRDVTSLTATRVNEGKPIAIDGSIVPEQWAGSMVVDLGENQSFSVDGDPWSASDRSAAQYVKWDDDYLYLAVEVTDDIHSMDAEDVYGSWGSDSLQISFDPERAGGYTAGDGNHPRFIASLNANTGVSAIGVETWGKVTTGQLSDIHAKFQRDEINHKTNYVIAFPWNSILTDDRKPATANLTDIGISILVNDNDGSGREGWLAYMGGIASGKDPSQFGDLILTDLTSIPVPGAEPPVTTASVSPANPDGQNGWYVHPITVTLTTESAVAKTEYSLDGGNTWHTYTAPVMIDQDARYSFSYRSTDRSGNTESTHSIDFNLDVTAPVITVSAPSESNYSDSGDLSLQFTVTDILSGVDETKTVAELDGHPVQQSTTIPLYTLPLGTHKFTVQAVDLAGNPAKVEISFETYANLESLKALVQHFEDKQWIDNAGIVNSLLKKLENEQLNAFMNEVEAQSGKHISAEAASYLLRDTQAVINAAQ